MKRHTSIRSLFEGYPGKDTNPDLRDLVPEEDSDAPFLNRTEGEDRCFSILPGDPLGNHIHVNDLDIPYLYTPPSQLRALHDDPDTPASERRKIVRVMKLIRMIPEGPQTEPDDLTGWEPNCTVSIKSPGGKTIRNVTLGNNISEADPFGR
jgi:hypothetical protein